VGTGFSPLDERLGLLPGQRFTPRLVEGMVRLGTALPFGQVPALLEHFSGVRVGVETVRRLTEAAGAVQLACEEAELATLLRELPDPPAGPAVQQLSLDGAMVPLVGGEWAEVKTLAIGTVELAGCDEVGQESRTTTLSYCSRLSDAASFGQTITLETHRRGTLAAGTVVAVNDGARWIQEVLDLQCPQAVRILDFPHAVAHLHQVAHACWEVESPEARAWVEAQVAALLGGTETLVLTRLADLSEREDLPAEARQVAAACQHYLANRREQIRYATFQAAGYPIGSGCVESANKVLVEARLKGAGMHWQRQHVNALLALRCLERNGRWRAAWPRLWQELRCQAHTRSRQRRQHRQSVAAPPPAVPPVPVAEPERHTRLSRPKRVVNGKPTADHPWRSTFILTAKR
jgi:hypothetical protein